jgi:hypothetical protein
MNIVSKAAFALGAASVTVAASTGYAHALVPYQAMSTVADSSTCPSQQCEFSFPAVPPGMRLLVTSVSAQISAENRGLVLEGNGVTYFVAKASPGSSFLNTPVTLFYEAGESPSARIFSENPSAHYSLLVTIVGQLDPQ